MTQLELQAIEVPSEVLGKYPIEAERTQILGGGLVNCTYLVEGQGKKIILQKLGDVVHPELIADADIYTRHLASDGWEAPLLIKTDSGDNFCEDEIGNKWRGLHHIESDITTPAKPDNKTLEKMGIMLARWHRTMAWLDYEPTYGIPHFHEIEYYAQRLYENTGELPSLESNRVASEILEAYRKLPPFPQSPSLLVHGDPKLNNMLFRDGKPLTLVDFDTVMEGPAWVDIGDMLRSLLAKDISSGLPIDKSKVDSVAEGYFDAARPGIRLANFVENSVLATKHISLELAMRYLIDINDDYYFNWDPKAYDSRHDNHLTRGKLMWRLFSSLDN